MLENFSAIKVENPVDIIIRQVRALITSGQLAPGDRLPAERKMAERLGVSRSHVRDAIRKLEFYGILRTLPQSGTVVAGLGIAALEGLITDVLQLEERDFGSLVETRIMLELQCVKLAAERRTTDDLIEIERALGAYEEKTRSGGSAVEEDLLYHLAIADASKNSVLKSLMMIITPDIISQYVKYAICGDRADFKAHHEHVEILRYIREQDTVAVQKAMQRHLSDVAQFSKTLNGQN
ncbi:HTH-type transcriptional regulator LutR [Neolewinella maritima]|uniref:HTH-type transcriptional regulator LutR n=1 Tax=Neolewinella maritima TaxID=1383882 RepID=A0ABM9AVN1_9BACT|nr:FadR/GntR family transcriptional regulator [Neolewinella maritima]CAH0998693.1 HTH-type transcriptional regulator LutR [Neolewinella maritima]